MEVGKILEQIDDKIDFFKRKRANLIEVHYKNYLDANQLVENQSLFLPEGWKAYIPDTEVTRSGIGKGICTDISEDEIMSQIEKNHPNLNIIRVERFTRNSKKINNGRIVREPTETVKFVFGGNKIPKEVKIYKWMI